MLTCSLQTLFALFLSLIVDFTISLTYHFPLQVSIHDCELLLITVSCNFQHKSGTSAFNDRKVMKENLCCPDLDLIPTYKKAIVKGTK